MLSVVVPNGGVLDHSGTFSEIKGSNPTIARQQGIINVIGSLPAFCQVNFTYHIMKLLNGYN